MVITFVAIPDLVENAKALDYKRLGKQRLEAKEIINVLEVRDYNLANPQNQIVPQTTGWQSHPTTKMWYGYTNALKVYYNHIVREWVRRGYQNTMKLYDIDESRYYINPYIGDGKFQYQFTEYSFPPWFAFPPFVLSHRAALLRKNPNFYAHYNVPEVQAYLPYGYLWPGNYGNEIYTNWDMKYLEVIGTGAPSHYRITREECIVWLQNHLINPKTGRVISEKGALYKDYVNASKHYGLIY